MIRTIENNRLQVRVKPSGAEAISIFDINKEVEYLWQGDPEYWGRRAPVLFPVVGKLNDNTYTVDNKEYKLPQHGFARNLIFDLFEETGDSLTFLLQDSDETRKYYPFGFKLYITYKLSGNQLTISYTVKNSGDSRMLFSIGAHPAFNVPVNQDESFEDYYIEFENEETEERHLLNDGLLNGEKEMILRGQKKLPLKREYFDKDAIVLLGLSSKKVWLKSRKSDYALEMDFEGFPYFGIWSPPGDAPFICLEPWNGHADTYNFSGDLSEKEGIISLDPDDEFKRSFTIAFA